MQAIERNLLETMLRFVIGNYEEMIESIPEFAFDLSAKFHLPHDQLYLAFFAEDFSREREDAKLTWKQSDGWLKFEAHKDRIFKNELFNPTSYSTPSGEQGYLFQPASLTYNHIFWNIYRELGGDSSYTTSDELLEQFTRLVSGLRILEIGCGPGFALRVLQDLGAHCKGIDIRNLTIPDIFNPVVGDARCLPDYFGDDEFDLIISRDFFCEGVIISQEDSRKVLDKSSRLLKSGGRMINEINFFRMDTPMYLVAHYFATKKQGLIKNVDQFIEYLFNTPDVGLNIPKWTNRLSIRIDDCVAAGFTGFSVQPEAEYLSVILRK